MPNSMFENSGLRKEDFIALTKSITELDLSDSIHKIECPTLVVYGSKDKANRDASVALASIISNAELQVIDGAGHEVNTQAPEKLAQVINSFYARNGK